MEIPALRLTQQGAVTPPQNSTSSAANPLAAGTTGAISTRLDQIVIPTTQSSKGDIGEDDAMRRNPDQSKADGLMMAKDGRAKGVTTVLSYNLSTQTSFMEIKTADGYKIASFPPENIKSWLNEQMSGIDANNDVTVSQSV